MVPCKDIILVVDDDLAVRESLKFALELEGIKVRVCGSGAELLTHPDLPRARCLVLDYKMPLMDGFEVIAQLAVRNIDIPIILITSPVTGAIRRRADAVGVERIVEKPLLDSKLRDAIHNVLAHRPSA